MKVANLEKIREVKMKLTRFMMVYKFALDEINTRIDILKQEFHYSYEYNPIEHVKSRLKTPESIIEKVYRRGYDLTLPSIRENVKDIAGVRITCSFTSDIYRISEMLQRQKDIRTVEIKDYIKNPKLNGYKSLHLIIEVPVFMSDQVENVYVEIQIRTIAMDFWASLEHKIYYKYDKEVPQYLSLIHIDVYKRQIYIDDVLFDATLDFLDFIKSIGGRYVFLTNNSSKSIIEYISKLTYLGIEVDKDNFLTSSQATALYLRENYMGKKIYVLGTKSLKKELKEYDIYVVDIYEEGIDCLVVGYDTELTYKKLVEGSRLLTEGVDFIATNPDYVCPVSFGYVPDCGSICDMLYNATKRRPKFIGKPNATMVELAIKNSGFTSEETIVIGDRLYTDIAAGNAAQVTTALVLSGETKREDIEVSEFTPDYIFKDIGEILKNISK